MATNKRKFRRINFKASMTAVGFTTPQGVNLRRSYQLPLEDISAGGLRYTSKFAPPVGTRLDLVFQLADRKVRGTVEVVRATKTKSGTYDIGCQFVSINPVTQEDIIKFVTLASVRDTQPSSFYSLKENVSPTNQPITCVNCRCADCADKEACRACYKSNCGKRFCRMYRPARQDLRRKL